MDRAQWLVAWFLHDVHFRAGWPYAFSLSCSVFSELSEDIPTPPIDGNNWEERCLSSNERVSWAGAVGSERAPSRGCLLYTWKGRRVRDRRGKANESLENPHGSEAVNNKHNMSQWFFGVFSSMGGMCCFFEGPEMGRTPTRQAHLISRFRIRACSLPTHTHTHHYIHYSTAAAATKGNYVILHLMMAWWKRSIGGCREGPLDKATARFCWIHQKHTTAPLNASIHTEHQYFCFGLSWEEEWNSLKTHVQAVWASVSWNLITLLSVFQLSEHTDARKVSFSIYRVHFVVLFPLFGPNETRDARTRLNKSAALAMRQPSLAETWCNVVFTYLPKKNNATFASSLVRSHIL